MPRGGLTDATCPVCQTLPRVGQPEEVGAIIATLASGRLPYTTGQAISADAGMLVPRF